MKSPIENWKEILRRLLLGILIVVGGPALAAMVKPTLLSFTAVTSASVLQLLTPLFVIALFMERAVEVFITAWRGPQKALKALAVETAKAAIRRDKTDQQETLNDARRKLVEYTSETQRLAFLALFALGIVVSALGVRALERFLDPLVFNTITEIQKTLIRSVDVLITGALLGGGSEGIHKLLTAITTFLDQTSKRLKDPPGAGL